MTEMIRTTETTTGATTGATPAARPAPVSRPTQRGELARIVAAFQNLSVLVIGDAILDCYLHGAAERLCREAPVPIVDVEGREDVPGGAANTATNIRALGSQVRFLSIVGDDQEGRLLREALTSRGVRADDVLVEEGRRTLAKTRVVADQQIMVRFDVGSTREASLETEARVIDRLRRSFGGVDAVICSDYGYGVLTPRVLSALRSLQRRDPRLLVVDAKELGRYRSLHPSAVKPNYQEAAALVGASANHVDERVQRALSWADALLDRTNAHVVALTLDREGALVFERSAPPHRTYARPTTDSRATGAGDTFLAALTLGLAAGATTPAAAELASAASEVVVAKDGTSTCSASEVLGWFWMGEKLVADRSALRETVAFLRRQGKSVVFTNGCFDILHRGHIAYLNQAKSRGDVLLIGLNSDESVRRLKGPERPINPLEDRAQVLSALSCVDYIVPFQEDSPVNLIGAIRPDIYVKGGDYTEEMLPEAPLVRGLGGRVEILPFVENRSTTGIIERIRTRPA